MAYSDICSGSIHCDGIVVGVAQHVVRPGTHDPCHHRFELFRDWLVQFSPRKLFGTSNACDTKQLPLPC